MDLYVYLFLVKLWTSEFIKAFGYFCPKNPCLLIIVYRALYFKSEFFINFDLN